MVHITVTGLDGVAGMMARIAGAVGDMRDAYNIIGLNLIRSTMKRFRSGNGWPPSIAALRDGRNTMIKSGASGLMGSIGAPNNQGIFDVTASSVVVGTNKRYARILQDGGAITPKKGKSLAIPLTKEAERAMVGIQSIRQIPGLVWQPSKKPGSAGVLGKFHTGTAKDKRYKKGDFQMWFALRRSVTIKGRPYLYIEENDLAMIQSVMDRHIDKAAQ